MRRHIWGWWAVVMLGATLPITCQVTTTFASPLENLTAAQVKSLKAVGITIAIPTYVPKGFKVAKVTTQPCPSTARKDAKGICTARSSYKILYRHPGNTCFAVYGEFTRGIGGGIGEFAFPVVTDLLGKTAIGFGQGGYAEKTPSPKQLNSPQPKLASFPVYQPGTSIVYGVRTEETGDGCRVNRSLTPLDVQKILQSLVWLK